MPIKVPLPISRRNPIQRIAHIGAHILVPVLVQRERAAGVLYEEVEHADFVIAEFGELGQDFVGYEVGAARAGGEGEGFLEPGHFSLLQWWLRLELRWWLMLLVGGFLVGGMVLRGCLRR
jgi:hypothetical protein